MWKRIVTPRVKKLLGLYPAVSLAGPRQSGKTTLAKTFSSIYFDLEKQEDRLRLDLEWPALTKSNQLIILDEAQAAPEVFTRLRSAIDERRKKNGRFLILGSIAPALMKNISESLAGRVGLCELSPFSSEELAQKKTLDQLWLYGGFPDGGILKHKSFPEWQSSYLQLLAQRDLPNWGLSAKPQTTLRLFRMSAAHHGQIWQPSQVASSMGVSYHTINHYMEYLQNSFLVTMLAPYHRNTKKRLMKSPKVYWNDSGLLHSMMNVSNAKSLLDQPWVGASWEGFCIRQICIALQNHGIPFTSSFLRTSDGREIDLVIEMKTKRIAIEFKLTSSPDSSDMRRLAKTAELDSFDIKILVSRTARIILNKPENLLSTNLPGAVKALVKIA